MSEPLLRIESLAGGYGATRILHGLDSPSAAGGVTALLGANGAGKTTLMKTLAGVLPVERRAIRFRGEDITGRSAAARVLAGIVLVPEGRLVFPEPERAREPAPRRRQPRAPAPAGAARSTRCTRSSRSCSSAATRPRPRSRAASSRCWRSAAA